MEIPYILSIIVFLPAVSGLLMMLIPGDKKKLFYKIALVIGLITFLLSIVIFVSFDMSAPGYQFEEQYEWLPAAGRGQVAALVVKHVMLVAFVIWGTVIQIRLKREMRTMPDE